jgi:hypothetical protein
LDRTSLWKILRHYGIPKLVLNIVNSLYDGGCGKLMYKGKLSDLKTGVRQECFISPFLNDIDLLSTTRDQMQRHPEEMQNDTTKLALHWYHQGKRRATRPRNT